MEELTLSDIAENMKIHLMQYRNSEEWENAVRKLYKEATDAIIEKLTHALRRGSDLTREIMDNLPDETGDTSQGISAALSAMASKYNKTERSTCINMFTEYLKRCFAGNNPVSSKLIDEIYSGTSVLTKEKFAKLNALIYKTIQEAILSENKIVVTANASDPLSYTDKKSLACNVPAIVDYEDRIVANQYETNVIENDMFFFNRSDGTSRDDSSDIASVMTVALNEIVYDSISVLYIQCPFSAWSIRESIKAFRSRFLIGTGVSKQDDSIVSNTIIDVHNGKGLRTDYMEAIDNDSFSYMGNLEIPYNIRTDKDYMMRAPLELVMELTNESITRIANAILRKDHALEDILNMFFLLWGEDFATNLIKRGSPDYSSKYDYNILSSFYINEEGSEKELGKSQLIKSIMGLILSPVTDLEMGGITLKSNSSLDCAARIAGVSINTVKASALAFGYPFFYNTVGAVKGNDSFRYSTHLLSRLNNISNSEDLISTDWMERTVAMLKETVLPCTKKFIFPEGRAEHNEIEKVLEAASRSSHVALTCNIFSIVERLIMRFLPMMSTQLGVVITNSMYALNLIGFKAAAEAASYDLGTRPYNVVYGLSGELIHVVAQQSRRERGWSNLMRVAVPVASLLAKGINLSGDARNGIYYCIFDRLSRTSPSYTMSSDDTVASVLGEIANTGTTVLEDFTGIEACVLSAFGFVSKLSQYFADIGYQMSERIDSCVTQEDLAKAMKSECTARVPNLRDKNILIITDIPDHREFCSSLGGIIKRSDRAYFEDMHRNVRKGLREGLYVIASKRPLFKTEIPSREDEVISMERCLTFRGTTDETKSLMIGTSNEISASFTSVDSPQTGSCTREWSNKLQYAIAEGEEVPESVTGYEMLFKNTVADMKPDQQTCTDICNASLNISSKISTLTRDYVGSRSNIVIVRDPRRFRGSRLIDRTPEEERHIFVIDKYTTFSSTLPHARATAEIDPRGTGHNTVYIKGVQFSMDGNNQYDRPEGFPFVERTRMLMNFWKSEESKDFKAVSVSVNPDIFSYCYRNVRYSNHGGRITPRLNLRDLVSIMKADAGVNPIEDKPAETPEWDRWITEIKEAFQGANNEGVNVQERYLRHMLMHIADTVDLNKELNIFMDIGTNGRRALAGLAGEAILYMSKPHDYAKRAQDMLDTDSKAVLAKSAEPAFIPGEISSVLLSSKKKFTKESITDKMNCLRSARDQYVKLYKENMAKLANLRKQMVAISTGDGTDPDETALKKLLDKKVITGARIIHDSGTTKVFVKFPPIHIWSGPFIYNMGEVSLLIVDWGKPSSFLKFFARKKLNKRWEEAGHLSDFKELSHRFMLDNPDAVHVRNGRACLGNISNILSNDAEIGSLYRYIVSCKRYLETVNLGDGYGVTITAWPCVPATLHNVIKYGVLTSGRITDRITLWTGSDALEYMCLAPHVIPDSILKGMWNNAKAKLDNRTFCGSDLPLAAIRAKDISISDVKNQSVSSRLSISYDRMDLTVEMGEKEPVGVPEQLYNNNYTIMSRLMTAAEASGEYSKEFLKIWGPSIKEAEGSQFREDSNNYNKRVNAESINDGFMLR